MVAGRDERMLFDPFNHSKKRLPWNGGLLGLRECLMALMFLSISCWVGVLRNLVVVKKMYCWY